MAMSDPYRELALRAQQLSLSEEELLRRLLAFAGESAVDLTEVESDRLERSLGEASAGEGRDYREVIAELREKYGLR